MNLLDWNPPCRILAFPLASRIGRIREVASKLHEKSTERAVDHYRRQVTEGMIGHLDRLGAGFIGTDWRAVAKHVVLLEQIMRCGKCRRI
jgi:hypothetical protein